MVSWDKVGRPRIWLWKSNPWQTATLLSCSFIVYFGGNLALPSSSGCCKNQIRKFQQWGAWGA